jgi:hypothetical protein
MDTRKCNICDRRFRLHTWQIGAEQFICFTCKAFTQYLMNKAREHGGKDLKDGLIGLLSEFSKNRITKEMSELDEKEK